MVSSAELSEGRGVPPPQAQRSTSWNRWLDAPDMPELPREAAGRVVAECALALAEGRADRLDGMDGDQICYGDNCAARDGVGIHVAERRQRLADDGLLAQRDEGMSVVDTNPVATLEAHFDGFATPVREEAIGNTDILITVTGAPDVLTAADLPLFKDGAILLNAGHFPWGVAVEAIEADNVIEARSDVGDTITTWQLGDGRTLHLLGRGHMLNLAGPRPPRQRDRVDGSRLHLAGALPRGDCQGRRGSRRVRGAGACRHRRRGGQRIFGPRPRCVACRRAG